MRYCHLFALYGAPKILPASQLPYRPGSVGFDVARHLFAGFCIGGGLILAISMYKFAAVQRRRMPAAVLARSIAVFGMSTSVGLIMGVDGIPVQMEVLTLVLMMACFILSCHCLSQGVDSYAEGAAYQPLAVMGVL